MGVLKLGMSLCCIGRGHLTLPCSLHPKMNSLSVCSVCSVSFCIHFWPFHLGIDSWPFAMVQTHFVPRKLGEHITQDGPPFGLLKGTCTHIWFTTAGFVPNSDSDMSMSSWFSTAFHGFPMDFPCFFHAFAAGISFNCPRWRHFSEMISRRESMGISPKTRGVQMVSAIIISITMRIL